jgi:hypothetical protein
MQYVQPKGTQCSYRPRAIEMMITVLVEGVVEADSLPSSTLQLLEMITMMWYFQPKRRKQW